MTRKILLYTILILILAALIYLFKIFQDYRLFIIFLPMAIGFNCIKNKRLRNIFITIFVIMWLVLFHYESTRHFYLNGVLKNDFPKTKFLFPPAGWIMFYSVGQTSGYYEVYGVKNDKPQLLDPHDILRTRTIGYDNIHRGILGTAANKQRGKEFCRFLKYRFPYFEKFIVVGVYIPEMIENPYNRIDNVQYQCVY